MARPPMAIETRSLSSRERSIVPDGPRASVGGRCQNSWNSSLSWPRPSPAGSATKPAARRSAAAATGPQPLGAPQPKPPVEFPGAPFRPRSGYATCGEEGTPNAARSPPSPLRPSQHLNGGPTMGVTVAPSRCTDSGRSNTAAPQPLHHRHGAHLSAVLTRITRLLERP